MKEYPMIAIEEEEHYLSDKHRNYKEGWKDSKFNKPPKKIGIYFILIEFSFSIFLICVCAKKEYGLIKSK